MESAMTMSQDETPRPGEPVQPGDGVEKSATEASQGTKTGYMRWVLVISLALGVVVLGAAYATYTASHHHPGPSPAAQAAAMTPVPAAG
jgi:hypothetical protein